MDPIFRDGSVPRDRLNCAPEVFVRQNTTVVPASLAPEIRLHLASEIAPIWHATEEALAQREVPPPFWAFCWPGGQALARHILDTPSVVRHRRVLDFAAGCGVAAIAAAKSGASSVLAADIDPYAAVALRLNAAVNGVAFEVTREDLVGRPNPGWDVVIAGDVCYERPMSENVVAWLRGLSAAGVDVLMGDPGRNFMPEHGLEEIARYDVPTSRELEDQEMRTTVVWRVLP